MIDFYKKVKKMVTAQLWS